MIYVTGDMHGDISRFKCKELRWLKKTDFVIVCGDFGFVWNNSKEEQKNLKWIGKRRYTTLFVNGTHDNLEAINAFPEVDFLEGKARNISGKLYFLSKGHIFNLGGKKVFAFGGGESDDMDIRLGTNTWWEEELPTQQETEESIKRLAEQNNKIDYVITHQAAPKIEAGLLSKSESTNTLTHLLNYVSKNCEFDKWFFGKYHIDKAIPISYRAVFKDVVKAYNK